MEVWLLLLKYNHICIFASKKSIWCWALPKIKYMYIFPPKPYNFPKSAANIIAFLSGKSNYEILKYVQEYTLAIC